MADFPSAADWREADAAWEGLQQGALTAHGENDHSLARLHTGQALSLAREHFRTGDPRLAATLACQARLLRDESPSLAAGLFQEALAHWAQAPAWLARQPPPERLARSSSFHLRLENKHPGAYRKRLEADMRPLLTIGQELTLGLRDADGSPRAAEIIEARPESVQAFDTHRKVKTAIDLLRGSIG